MFEYYCAQGLYTSDKGTKTKKLSTSLDSEEKIDKSNNRIVVFPFQCCNVSICVRETIIIATTNFVGGV